MSVQNLKDQVDSLISKYESLIQASAEEIRKHDQNGNHAQSRYYMGLEKAYQNIYKDLTGAQYEPELIR